MTVPAPAAARPLFGGYALVALVAAWVAGIAAHGALDAIGPRIWLGISLVAAGLALGGAALARRAIGRSATLWRRIFVAGLLACALALGAARAASSDPAGDPHSIARLVSAGTQVRVRGMVAAEPDVRDGLRLLTLDVSGFSLDGGRTWGPAAGRVQAVWYGPDDWFAPAYGDMLSLTGTLDTDISGAPPGIVARLSKTHGTIAARGGGNPLLGWLFGVRLALAQAIQHALPEPEAALLIGILLGLKTPALRARLPLFTTTGTIHLVVPAGLKVSVLATLASGALRPLGRWPRIAGSIFAVGVYAALGGGGAAAIRAAIMGGLLVLAPALGRTYNVFTALALAVLAMTAAETQGGSSAIPTEALGLLPVRV